MKLDKGNILICLTLLFQISFTQILRSPIEWNSEKAFLDFPYCENTPASQLFIYDDETKKTKHAVWVENTGANSIMKNKGEEIHYSFKVADGTWSYPKKVNAINGKIKLSSEFIFLLSIKFGRKDILTSLLS